MIRRSAAIVFATLAALAMARGAQAAEAPCELEPRSLCFGLESVDASISTHQAGGHPDLTLSFALKQDPETEPNNFGLQKSYAAVRRVRIETPPGLVGDPNMLGVSQQCTVQVLLNWTDESCPNGSMVGRTRVLLYSLGVPIAEPLYMMQPPGGDVVARLGFIAGIYPTFIDLSVRSEDQDDFGLTATIDDTSPQGGFVQVDTTLWGVPAAEEHDTERCTAQEAFGGCTESPPRPPGSRPLSFMTNPTRCGVPLSIDVSVASWDEPDRFVSKGGELEPITGCDRVPFNPSLFVQPTSRRAGAPTGLELSFRLPAPDGVGVLESSQLKDIRIDFPVGMAVNTASADGLETCSVDQVRFGRRVNAECPDAAKLGETEFDVPALPRRMKGAIYLREPEPGHLFRVWVVADDQGAHIKLPGELEIDESTGQISSVVLGVPQVPVREVRLVIKSGFRAPLVNPASCGTYQTHWEFTPWSGTGTVGGETPMTIDQGCDAGGFDPKLSAGSTDPAAGKHAPFVFALTREDGEQNPASLDIALPPGLAATFKGIARCEGFAADTGACPPESKVGHVLAATGAGPNPLWVPQPGKRPTAVYLGGPYKGAPLSVIAVVPAQAGPFDLGDQVVRSAIYVDPRTAQASIKSDPLPQIIQGIPVTYRTIHVAVDKPNFTLNPTGCREKSVDATVTSNKGAVANPSSPFSATNCAALPFKPKLTLRLRGGTRRGQHPALTATLRPRPGDANIASVVTAFPKSEFLENAHIRTVCTRADFAADNCPAGAAYGTATVWTPLFDEPLSGNVYLRSSSNLLPDLVPDLRGPASLPVRIESAGRTDSINGGIRNSFDFVPDAPFTRLALRLQGAGKGLLVNSRDICAHTYRATVRMTAHNGRKRTLHPKLQADCGKKGKKGKAKRSSHRRAGRVG
jgi:hypothetical protein